MVKDFEFVYNLTENQIMNLMDMYREEAWSKNREIDDVKRMLDKSFIIAIIDSSNGRIIAFARVISDFVYRAFMYDVIVAKDYRGKGFGKLIVESLLNHKDLKNVERIELNCIDSNVPFYEKLGFRKVPISTNMMRYIANLKN